MRMQIFPNPLMTSLLSIRQVGDRAMWLLWDLAIVHKSNHDILWPVSALLNTVTIHDNKNISVPANLWNYMPLYVILWDCMQFYQMTPYSKFLWEMEVWCPCFKNGMTIYQSTIFHMSWKSNIGKHMIDILLNAHIWVFVVGPEYSVTKVKPYCFLFSVHVK
jgi:hypothetical protein